MPRSVPAALCCASLLACLGRAALAQDAPAPVLAPPDHYFILLFDYPAGGLRQSDDLSAAVEGWIAARLLPGDAVAVASYYGCELQVQQDFTRDRAALTAAITDAVKGRPHDGRPPEGGAPSLVARLPASEELARRTANFYGLYQAVAEAAAGVPGRKNLLVFSKGFGRSHLFESDGGPVVHAAVTGTGSLGNPIQEKYLADRHLYAPTLSALQDAAVTLYPVDLATDYRETYPLAGVMAQLAAGTGGRYFYPVTSVAALLDRVSADEAADTPAGRIAAAPAGAGASSAAGRD